MNRSFRAPDSQMQQASLPRRQPGRNQLGSMMKEKEEELALFLEMRKREKERNNQLLIHNSEEFDAPLVSKPGSSPIFKIVPSAPARKTSTDDFLNSDNDKDDYDWLMTPPGTPLFPSLEMESQKTVMSQIGTPTSRPAAPKSRLANPQSEPASRTRQPTLSPGLNSSSVGIRRPSSSGGPGSTASRPATPTGRPTLPAMSKQQPSRPSRPSTPTSRGTLSSSKPTAPPARSSTPSARSSTPSARSSTPSARSSTPSARSSTSTARSSTPTARSSTPTARSSTPSARPSTTSTRPSTTSARPSTTSARSSTPTSRSTVPASKSTSRSGTPTRRPSTPSSASNVSALTRSSSVIKSGPTTMRNPVPSCGSSPTIKSRPWKPSEMPGFSLDAPPNLRTSMPARPVSASRGRPGAPSAQSSSENGRPRRQSCSPSRGRAPNNGSIVHSSRSSVPASSRAYYTGNDHVNPVLMGTQMVERVVNMRKLAPPKQDDQRSGHNTGKSSSLDSSGFGRSLSKKSLDMAMRHMDIRRSVPGSLRPLMTNIPASSMYSVRSGPPRSRPVSVSDSPLATSSNASSEQSINNNTLCLDGCEAEDDDLLSERVGRSPVSQCGR